MNTKLSLQNPGKEFPVFGRRVGSTVISTIDRRRIFILIPLRERSKEKWTLPILW